MFEGSREVLDKKLEIWVEVDSGTGKQRYIYLAGGTS